MEKRTNEVNDGFLQHTFDHTGASCDDFFFFNCLWAMLETKGKIRKNFVIKT